MRPILAAAALSTFWIAAPSMALAQADPADPDAFASENAILDTSLPFAIGAREARQELRGSFGWPTYQEGLVQGVYFRFDPDGYARFAPTPRLDTDVFEVVCRPRTLTCMGRKGPMSVLLTERGQIELRFEDVIEGDRFFLIDGINEIEVPTRVVQPLDQALEILLSGGGDLAIRRGDTEVERISLAGFAAVTSYLRWVAARQDYIVLPRGWPVPNSTVGGDPAGLTQALSWQSPMPQPQQYPVQPVAASDLFPQLQNEINDLRNQIVMLTARATAPAAPATPPQGWLPISDTIDPTAAMLAPADPAAPVPGLPWDAAATVSTTTDPFALPDAQSQVCVQNPTGLPGDPEASAVEAGATNPDAERDDLMARYGLDEHTAELLLELQNQLDVQPATAEDDPALAPQYQERIVTEIIAELLSQVEDRSQAPQDPEYVLLSDYFSATVADQTEPEPAEEE